MALNKPRIDPKATSGNAAAETAVADAAPKAQDSSLDWDENKAGTQVAAPAPSPAPSAAPTVGTQVQKPAGGAMMAAGEDDGFGALDNAIGFGSFPIIKLDKGKYRFGDEDMGEEFKGVIGGAREKHLFKMDDNHLVYSYDGLHDDSGRPLESHYADWRADGCDKPVQQATYMEVVVLVTDSKDGKYNGRFGLCSIPPRSVNRLGGYRAEIKMGKRKTLKQVVTRFVIGREIQVSKSINFNPWEFLFDSYYTPPPMDDEG